MRTSMSVRDDGLAALAPWYQATRYYLWSSAATAVAKGTSHRKDGAASSSMGFTASGCKAHFFGLGRQNLVSRL